MAVMACRPPAPTSGFASRCRPSGPCRRLATARHLPRRPCRGTSQPPLKSKLVLFVLFAFISVYSQLFAAILFFSFFACVHPPSFFSFFFFAHIRALRFSRLFSPSAPGWPPPAEFAFWRVFSEGHPRPIFLRPALISQPGPRNFSLAPCAPPIFLAIRVVHTLRANGEPPSPIPPLLFAVTRLLRRRHAKTNRR